MLDGAALAVSNYDSAGSAEVVDHHQHHHHLHPWPWLTTAAWPV